MLKNLNVIKSQYAPKDKNALWLKAEGGNASLYWFDGMQWVALTSGQTDGVETYAELILGDTDEIRKANLSKLRPGSQLVKIDIESGLVFGYGIALYVPGEGGSAFIRFYDGRSAQYTISELGVVSEYVPKG